MQHILPLSCLLLASWMPFPVQGQTAIEYAEHGNQLMDNLNSWSTTDTSKNYQAALMYFSKAIELNRNSPDVYNKRGLLKSIYGKDYNGAIQDYTKAINLNNSESAYFENRAYASTMVGNYSSAIEDYDKAFSLGSDSYSLLFDRAQAKVEIGNYQEAIQDYTISIRSTSIIENPRDSFGITATMYRSYLERGKAKFALEDYRGAVQDFNKVIGTKCCDWLDEAYSYRARTYMILGDYQNALLDLDWLVKAFPYMGSYYIGRGHAKVALGEVNSGCLDFSKAGELGSNEAYDLIKKFCQ